MDVRRWSALFLVTIMTFAGCIGATEPAPENVEPTPSTYTLEPTWILAPTEAQLGDELTYLVAVSQEGEGEWRADTSVLQPNFSPLIPVQWSEIESGFQLKFTPITTGEHIVSIAIENTGETELVPSLKPLILTLNIEPPAEPAPILAVPNRLVLEQPNVVWFEGTVSHLYIDSCSVSYNITDGNDGTLALNEEGALKRMMDFTEATSSHTITTVANCGRYSVSSDTATTQVIIEGAGDDEDGDRIQDVYDRCPSGIGADEGWQSTEATDGDHDGCRDIDEDDDDDNDGIPDTYDLCAESYGWVSTPSADYDYDGCHDANEDLDDDNDGVNDVDDLCPVGRKGWSSNRYSDWDVDGCSDLDEDDNDDNDDHSDADDWCAKGVTNWNSDNTSDWDNDGCQDATEDDDDDNDGVNDVNGTGDELDRCPKTPINATDVNEFGCAAIERDSDTDGVNDLLDECEGTPAGLMVNGVGCADIDGDGVFANVDTCASSPERWSVDVNGCAVVQLPVDWTDASSLNGPMQVVPQFTFPTLNGTFNFNDRWTGHDVYFFMFKYTCLLYTSPSPRDQRGSRMPSSA